MCPVVDLRSDTVTKPTDEMREFMENAEVGDDVFGEDPTINELQSYCAELFGKEQALYVPSGTMANQASLFAHTNPGDEIICEYSSHIFNNECGGPAVLSGVQLHPIRGEHGLFSADQISEAIRSPPNVHHPKSKVVALENTHNAGGGVIYPTETIQEISDVVHGKNLILHLDGARLMNAVVETGISAREYAGYFDSLTLCFSKGLGAPVGSIVAGSAEFIEQAHRARKIFGGGMRQAGIVAAGALFAIQNNVERLQDDHARAKRLALALDTFPAVSIEPDWVHTNIVIFDVVAEQMNATDLCNVLQNDEVLMLPLSENRVRAATNLMVSDTDIDYAIEKMENVLT